eukprot:7032003-Lingulodinium_polyedra.AAC.1
MAAAAQGACRGPLPDRLCPFGRVARGFRPGGGWRGATRCHDVASALLEGEKAASGPGSASVDEDPR